MILFSLLGQALVGWSGLPLPGGVIGLGLVLALLASRLLRASNLQRGASLLLGEMLLFFVPAVMSLLDHREFIGLLGLKLLLVIVLGTALVMAGTAITIELPPLDEPSCVLNSIWCSGRRRRCWPMRALSGAMRRALVDVGAGAGAGAAAGIGLGAAYGISGIHGGIAWLTAMSVSRGLRPAAVPAARVDPPLLASADRGVAVGSLIAGVSAWLLGSMLDLPADLRLSLLRAPSPPFAMTVSSHVGRCRI